MGSLPKFDNVLVILNHLLKLQKVITNMVKDDFFVKT